MRRAKGKKSPKKRPDPQKNRRGKTIYLPQISIFGSRVSLPVTGKKVKRFTSTFSLAANTLVQYYDAGWRYGYYQGESSRGVKIQPIAAYKAPAPRCLYIPSDRVKEVGN